MRVKRKYLNTLESYLRWITDDFLRPKYQFDANGISAAEAMLRWETYGEALPTHSSEPEMLAKYVQGKTSRDFYIKSWKDGIKAGDFLAEEFLGTLGMDEKEFRSVFGREPDPKKVLLLQTIEEVLKDDMSKTCSHEEFTREVNRRIKDAEFKSGPEVQSLHREV